MGISANDINNIFMKSYLSQIKKSNADTDTGELKPINQDKLLQDFSFQVVLKQMLDSMADPMMSDLLSTALSNKDATDGEDELGLMSLLNSNMRSVSSLQGYNSSTYSGKNGLGAVASKYESNSDPGSISNINGDYGGKSYGAWQLSSKTGSLNSFIDWLRVNYGDYYNRLSEAKAKDNNAYGANFDAAWTTIARLDRTNFLKAQQDYTKQAYYDKAAQVLNSQYGFDVSKRSTALKESLWSTVVQHGVGGALSIFSKLNLKNNDRDIINDLYTERQKVDTYFRSSSVQVRQAVYNRFTQERQEMLSMLGTKNG